jgi:competence ComEA-like helix-hairpin-helix protein
VFIILIILSVIILLVLTMPNRDYLGALPLRVDLQKATAEELEFLPGIGPKMAQRIIEYRKTHELNTPEDLDGVYGIGKKKIKYLRWLVATEDEKE